MEEQHRYTKNGKNVQRLGGTRDLLERIFFSFFFSSSCVFVVLPLNLMMLMISCKNVSLKKCETHARTETDGIVLSCCRNRRCVGLTTPPFLPLRTQRKRRRL